jgi:GntR family transcriptional regulator / MocR family aminotransferase
VGSVSESLAPFLRLGWIACPPQLAYAVAREKRVDPGGQSGQRHVRGVLGQGPGQRGAAGGVDARIRRRCLSQRPAAMSLASASWSGRPAVGDLAARQRFICLLGMSHYRFNGAVIPPQLVLGFGNLSERTIRQGIAAIGDLLRGQP